MAQNTIPTLAEYLSRISGAHDKELAAMSHASVERVEVYDSMKAHVLKLYEGVQSVHSFEDDNGSIFDCIPVHQQPSLRGKQPATPTAMPAADPGYARNGDEVPSRNVVQIEAQLAAGRKD